MKIFIHYKEGSETDLHKTLKLTVPKKWLDKSPTKVLDLFVESYNARLVIAWICLKTLMFGIPLTKCRNYITIEPLAHHLENESGMALKEGDLIKNVMKDKVCVCVPLKCRETDSF